MKEENAINYSNQEFKEIYKKCIKGFRLLDKIKDNKRKTEFL